jgi:6-phosphofructokinase 1
LSGGGARALGVEVDVPRLGYIGEGVPSPFCTFQACPAPVTGPRTSVNLHSAFVSDEDRVLLKSISYGDATSSGAEDCNADCSFDPRWCVRAGPRARLYFRPSDVRAAVVTCGGLCPGLNDVIRSLVTTLESGYGVSDIVGIPFGYRGFFEAGLEIKKLTKKSVNNIHLEGGSVLGTSRGGGDVNKIVDSIITRRINQLYVLGGNGTHAGAAAIYEECVRRRYVCAVVGVPKTIDNDILLVRPRRWRVRSLLARASHAVLSWTRHLASTRRWRRHSARFAPHPSKPSPHTEAWAW